MFSRGDLIAHWDSFAKRWCARTQRNALARYATATAQMLQDDQAEIERLRDALTEMLEATAGQCMYDFMGPIRKRAEKVLRGEGE